MFQNEFDKDRMLKWVSCNIWRDIIKVSASVICKVLFGYGV